MTAICLFESRNSQIFHTSSFLYFLSSNLTSNSPLFPIPRGPLWIPTKAMTSPNTNLLKWVNSYTYIWTPGGHFLVLPPTQTVPSRRTNLDEIQHNDWTVFNECNGACKVTPLRLTMEAKAATLSAAWERHHSSHPSHNLGKTAERQGRECVSLEQSHLEPKLPQAKSHNLAHRQKTWCLYGHQVLWLGRG